MTEVPGWNFDKFAAGIRAMGVGDVPVSGVIPGAQHGTDTLISNFASVNLLNLQRRDDVMNCLIDAPRKYGVGSGGTRVIQGITPAHVDMERTVAAYLGKEAAISFATGTVANIGFANAMAGTHQFMPGLAMVNRDVVFVFDRDAHWSLWKAVERGEGGGVVVLKRAADALADGDPIYCLLLGGAVNHDGASQALTVPDTDAQHALLSAAYRQAGVEPGQVQYVELHGTGTRAGDPVEARALGRVLGASRPAGRPLLVGSVKTNIGHLDAAAGAAVLIKVALSVRHGLIPASLNFAEPHPSIPLVEWNLAVNMAARAWPGGGPALAGVSSFGVGGANCHLVVGAPPEPASDPGERERPARAVPVVVSAGSAAALRAQASRLRDWLRANEELGVDDVGYSMVTTRSLLGHRGVVVAEDRDELLRGLEALANDLPAASVVTGGATGAASAAASGVVWVFPGQGSQWVGMALRLWDVSPVFAARMAECAQELSGLVDWSLRAVLADEEALTRVDVVQPALFAVMVSSADVWRSAGVVPSAIVGHSQGELAAACAAGIISLADGLRLAVARSRAIAVGLSGSGTMASLELPGGPDRQAFGTLALLRGQCSDRHDHRASSLFGARVGLAGRRRIGRRCIPRCFPRPWRW
ncbi:acyltransferase domain-containing protein [Frankia sp. QA3]|uniref:acyltransferase domain-containing protein n=1 Tax=Frankia sp. QA3 TaxID=710111 RepID=UPI000269BC10|nr:acyltransferase domain-containing protein [Frankia sp. QA3]EIV92671.1 acyltransferase family protein [Frankia sp. QA3]